MFLLTAFIEFRVGIFFFLIFDNVINFSKTVEEPLILLQKNLKSDSYLPKILML